MRRRLDMTHDALKFVEGLDAKQYRQVVRKTLALMDDPMPADVKKLKDSEFYRTDIGEYRIAYRFDAETVYVALIGKRDGDEIYKQLGRKS